jgi:hypothetical protein
MSERKCQRHYNVVTKAFLILSTSTSLLVLTAANGPDMSLLTGSCSSAPCSLNLFPSSRHVAPIHGAPVKVSSLNSLSY